MLDRLSVTGWLVALALCAWVGYELLRQPPSPPAAPSANPSGEVGVELPDLELDPPELDDLRITLDRPLFNVSRRPDESAGDIEVTAPTADPVPTGDPPLRLSAVILENNGSWALLEPLKTKKVQRLREGAIIEGWRLAEINEDNVVMTAGNARATLPLRVFDKPAPPKRTPARPRRREPAAARKRTAARATSDDSSRQRSR